MTRELEIINAIEKLFNVTKNCKPTYEMIGFRLGAHWADENPKSPWISVNDDLPNNPKYLKQPDYSSWVIVITENGEVLTAQMIVMHEKWIWHSRFSRKHEDITHWMFIPKFPMECLY